MKGFFCHVVYKIVNKKDRANSAITCTSPGCIRRTLLGELHVVTWLLFSNKREVSTHIALRKTELTVQW